MNHFVSAWLKNTILMFYSFVITAVIITYINDRYYFLFTDIKTCSNKFEYETIQLSTVQCYNIWQCWSHLCNSSYFISVFRMLTAITQKLCPNQQSEETQKTHTNIFSLTMTKSVFEIYGFAWKGTTKTWIHHLEAYNVPINDKLFIWTDTVKRIRKNDGQDLLLFENLISLK